MMNDVILELNSVSKSFDGPDGKVDVLNNLSISVSMGELVSVSGPSGCGKTTLLLVAGSLLQPDRGEVLFSGVNPYRLDSNLRCDLRGDRIGFVFQQFHLISYLNVLENVLLASVGRYKPDHQGRARELIKGLGLDHRLNHVPAQLSIGEQQRTALARALLNKPKILLADEPTGNLDPENSGIVMKSLGAFAKEGGAVLVVTHDAQAAAIADRKLRLQSG
ncbi:MAG: ABC transporter ATP-binding protein [Kiritimatiellae bacterium]|nr:ABC transporter ATP-binding protein [Kiritimatiellia bacterium]MDD5522816.1 ABC transporter ATP-binding protein [Kiritimatiellia bacterium]